MCAGVTSALGQLIVVMFLTYSGYGIMESVKKKGNEYLNGFLRKRVLKTLVHFDIAVAIFAVLALVLGHSYSVHEWTWSWIGWTSVGNSNWFIFDIIVLYLLTYAGLIITKKSKGNLTHFAWIVTVLSACFTIVMMKAKHGQFWWVDTIMTFPIGMLWSIYKTRIDSHLLDVRKYIVTLFVTVILFGVSYWAGMHILTVFQLLNAVLFAELLILLTMKLRLGNPVLNWLGINAFAIYILQRISMIVAKEFGLHQQPFLFMAVIIPATLLIAAIFTAGTNKLDQKFFR